MKSKKGFTLIELLAVIVILGVLLSLSVIAVNSQRKQQDKENLQNTISSILTGAKNYATDKGLLDNSLPINIEVDKLVKENYVDFDNNKDDFTGNVTITSCGDKLGLKLLYYYEYDGTIYNDCGCDSQVNDTNADKLCLGKSCTTDSEGVTKCSPIEQKN